METPKLNPGWALVFTMIATLTACSSIGNQQLKDQTQASISQKITEGRTTKTDITAVLGDASSIELTDGGNEVWIYKNVHKTPKTSAFIPIVGLFSSGADVTTKELRVMFNSGGVVLKYAMLESHDEIRRGILQ